MMPEPLQSGQFTIDSLFLAPLPSHSGQGPFLGIEISFSTPCAASSRVIERSYRRSAPLCSALPCPLLRIPPKDLPPKNLSKMSPKSNEAKSEKSNPAWLESNPENPDAFLNVSASP